MRDFTLDELMGNIEKKRNTVEDMVVCPSLSELKAEVNNVFCKQQLGELPPNSDMQTEIAKALLALLRGER